MNIRTPNYAHVRVHEETGTGFVRLTINNWFVNREDMEFLIEQLWPANVVYVLPAETVLP